MNGMSDAAIYSSMIRGGKTTYFVDVKEAKNGSKYLAITDSRTEGDSRKRTTVRIYGESIVPFAQAIAEACHILDVREGVSQ